MLLTERTFIADADEPPQRAERRHPNVGTRCADRIVDVLERAGIDTVYGIPGGAIGPIYDALIDHPRIRVVHTRHETSALFMAIGHATMKPGALPCVLVTSGPGVTNAVTGIAAARGEGVPVLVLGGEVPRSKFGKRALQEGSSESVDVLGIVRSVTASAECILIPGRAPFQVASAIERAREARGPVFLTLPLDVAMTPVPVVDALRDVRPPRLVDERKLDAAAATLPTAERPLLLVGSGARTAWAEVRAFAERFGIPVITSPKAKGIVPESASCCLGVFGYGGHPSAADWLRRHPPDVVLALGCGLSEPSTNSWSPLLHASRAMIQVDLDPAQFGRNYPTEVALQADCRDVLVALVPRLAGRPRWSIRPGGISCLEVPATRDDHTPLGHARVLAVVQEELPDDTVYTSDIGEHLLFAVHYLRLERPDQFISAMAALGSMGSGIGSAVGAQLAAPDRRVVAICGDYGFQMYGMELNTCVQERIAVTFLIMNDARMRMVEAGVRRNYGRSMDMHGPPVDFAMVARAHGARGFVVRTVAELRDALRNLASDAPTVLDVRVDPDATFPVNARVQEISNFTAT